MNSFSKILFFSLLIFFSNCKNDDKVECDLKVKVFNQIIDNEEVINYLHPEIKERIPFPIFFNNSNCDIKNDRYFFIKNEKLTESYIKVYSFILDKNNIKVSLFYNIEGVNINCLLKKQDNGEIEIVDVNFIEI